MPIQNTLDELSDNLIADDYETWTKFNIADYGTNGVIKYYVQDMAPGRADQVRKVFQYLKNVTGIDFEETTVSFEDAIPAEHEGTIYFVTDNNNYGTWSNSVDYDADGFTSFGTIGIGPDDPNSSDPDADANANILFEIMRVMGIEQVSTFIPDTQDNYQYSLMSLNNPDANMGSFDFDLPRTLMSVDLLAFDKVYSGQYNVDRVFGTAQAYTGDTVYGFNTNITQSVDPILSMLSTNGDKSGYTIVDGGGNDTFDFSGWSADQDINLTPSSADSTAPSTSSIGGRVGNLTLAVGTIIENAYGGAGNDSITGNSANNVLKGNAGNDTLVGLDGDDTLFGGAGADTLDGGAGSDTVSYADVNVAGRNVVVDLTQNTNNQNDTLISIENVDGSNFTGDRIVGDANTNILHGLGGNDVLFGNAGDDSVYGDAGRDWVLGGAGNDHGFGGADNDYVLGQDGNDTLHGDAGNDFVRGDAGNDQVFGDDGNDRVFGSAGNDVVRGDAGNDQVYGDDGNDWVIGGTGHDQGWGGTGNDYVLGEDGNDTLHGDAGNDFVRGDAGNDRVYGDDGNDRVFGSAGNDLVRGGAGNDLVYGDAGHDWLYGDAGTDRLWGGTGNDVLIGGAGTDYFYFDAHSGRDRILDFEDGIDKLVIDNVTSDQLSFSQWQNTVYISWSDSLIVVANADTDTVTVDDFVFI